MFVFSGHFDSTCTSFSTAGHTNSIWPSNVFTKVVKAIVGQVLLTEV